MTTTRMAPTKAGLHKVSPWLIPLNASGAPTTINPPNIGPRAVPASPDYGYREGGEGHADGEVVRRDERLVREEDGAGHPGKGRSEGKGQPLVLRGVMPR